MSISNTLGKKILFENAVATGVLVDTGDEILEMSAEREVILSAGALQSPQLLMVSGNGPKETLQQHNILLIAERPGVGQSLWVSIRLCPSLTAADSV